MTQQAQVGNARLLELVRDSVDGCLQLPGGKSDVGAIRGLPEQALRIRRQPRPLAQALV